MGVLCDVSTRYSTREVVTRLIKALDILSLSESPAPLSVCKPRPLTEQWLPKSITRIFGILVLNNLIPYLVAARRQRHKQTTNSSRLRRAFIDGITRFCYCGVRLPSPALFQIKGVKLIFLSKRVI